MPRSLKKFFILSCLVLFLLAPEWSAQQAFCDVANVQDPTRPPVDPNTSFRNSQSPRFQDWTLTSTLISPRRSIAIINGRIIQKGQVLAGVEIVTIKQGAVELRYGEDSFWLRVTNEIRKKEQAPSQETALQEFH